MNAVRPGEAAELYKDPSLFFARTYPTYKLKTLARDVLQRMAGQGGKPILQIQVAYGGGKTHTLITILHLAEQAGNLLDQASVREFLNFAGLAQGSLPKARVALLPFDKFDVINGLELYGPDGSKRTVLTPWGALAYQLGGEAALARIQEHEAKFVAPAEPQSTDILRLSQADGLATLVLDEAVWYYRGAVNYDRCRLGILKDFFQALTQAIVKVKQGALVASLIASRVEANDATGSECLGVLADVFGRMGESVEPVGKEDVAETLRRRLFESVPGDSERRPGIDAAMAQMQKLPVRDAQKDASAYKRFVDGYPFHPDLIEVMYSKWTQFSNFQRTRGALRLFALTMRYLDPADPSPMLGPRALLSTDESLSPAVVELIDHCEEKGKWTPILRGELSKAREVQVGFPSLQARELEQSVLATFLHSQPTGQRVDPPELYSLLVHPGLDVTASTWRHWRGRRRAFAGVWGWTRTHLTRAGGWTASGFTPA